MLTPLSSHPAIIVACLTSFRALYTKSERSRRGGNNAPYNKHSGSSGSSGMMPSISDAATLPIEEKNQNSTSVSVSAKQGQWQRQNSDDSSEEFQMPLGSVFVQHEFSVTGEPNENVIGGAR